MEGTGTTVQKRMTDVLMLADAPWLATIIMGVSQPFAQLRDATGLPPYFPLIVALLVSALIAAYWVTVEQRTRFGHSLLVMPVVTMLLFSASIGANNVLKAAATDPIATPQDSQALQAQNELLQKELDIERMKTSILSTASGRIDTSWTDDSPTGSMRGLASVFGWLSSAVHAQSEGAAVEKGRLTAEQRQKLQELEAEQRAIEDQRRRLAEEGGDKASNKSRPLWKSF